jgi:hypothetical protein
LKIKGSDYIFNCTIDNNSTDSEIKFYIFHDNQKHELNTTDRLSMNHTSGILKITNVLPSDNGIYECVTLNALGIQSYKIQLKIKSIDFS